MTAVLSLLVVLTLAFIITPVATVALTFTGMSTEMARFQARSAFTGCGFTTSEAEAVVAHPARRRVIMVLMQLGSAGVVGAGATLLLSFVNVNDPEVLFQRSGVLVGGLVFLLLIARSRWVERHLARAIGFVLRNITDLEVRDYRKLLRLSDGFAVTELDVSVGDWLEGRSLSDLDLPAEGIMILGIHRADGRYVAVPGGSTSIEAGDVVVIYGQAETIASLDGRQAGKSGAASRAAAVDREAKRQHQQDAEEARRGS